MKKNKETNKTKIERFKLIDSIDEARFIVSHPNEVLLILKQIKEKEVFLSAYSLDGKKSFMTLLFDINENRKMLVFDSPSDALLNRYFLNQGELSLATAIDRVRIQFDLFSIRETAFGPNPAYAAGFPTRITRFQRRDFYRLSVPISTPIPCDVPNRNSRWGGTSRYSVYDISVGGIGLNGVPLMRIGDKIHNMTVHLPEGKSFTVDAVACHTFLVQLRNGQKVVKTGFRYTTVCDQRDQKIQHFINQVTMERRSRESRQDKKKPQ